SLLGAAMDNCNAAADGKCLRYRKEWQNLKLGRSDFAESFERRIDTVCADLKLADLTNPQSAIFGGAARRAMMSYGRRFKLCYTSPPYLNSFDYSDVYRPELFLGRFVDSNAELALIRKSTIRSHVQANWQLPERSAFGKLYSTAIDEIRSRSGLLW